VRRRAAPPPREFCGRRAIGQARPQGPPACVFKEGGGIPPLSLPDPIGVKYGGGSHILCMYYKEVRKNIGRGLERSLQTGAS